MDEAIEAFENDERLAEFMDVVAEDLADVRLASVGMSWVDGGRKDREGVVPG